MKRTSPHILKAFWRNQQGVAYLEFALALPFLLLLFLGAVETTRYMLIAQKTGKIAMNISDIVAQTQAVDTEKLNNILIAARELMQPYDFTSNGYVIISSVSRQGSKINVDWQHAGGGTWIQTSHIGEAGDDDATLPTGFSLSNGDHVIVTEVFFQYTPMLNIQGNIVGTSALYRHAVFKPRLGDLHLLGG